MTDGRGTAALAREVPFFPTGPEALLHVDGVGGHAGDATGSMRTGPWMLGPGGVPAHGCLGVLIDVVWGGAAVACAPPELFGVSTDMMVSFGAPLSADGSWLRARGRSVHRDDVGALATGSVHAADGTALAVGTQRTRFAPGEPVLRPLDPVTVEGDAGRGIVELLALAPAANDAEALALPVSPALANPTGILHGGIQFCAAELAASRAVSALELGLAPASMQMVYLRPGRVGEIVRVAAEVVYRGRTAAAVHVRCLREDGKACSVATVSYGPVVGSNR